MPGEESRRPAQHRATPGADYLALGSARRCLRYSTLAAGRDSAHRHTRDIVHRAVHRLASTQVISTTAVSQRNAPPHDQPEQRTSGTTGSREAARLFAELAADRARVLGTDHRDTLSAREDYAWELGQAGEYAEAARLFAELAADRARVLGADDPRTLTARHNHAWSLGRAGEHAEAARLRSCFRSQVLGRFGP
ncbi:tetratricopeptide repeat protein [Streptomyces anulatus]|uniref:tetratricopeptide repeat protein n=1 Tax=Streptomyces anulatus TaxID=1892 RepID=UPI002E3635F8|nr:tetratricopeptide repeat protein [Streptomyces anulatus]